MHAAAVTFSLLYVLACTLTDKQHLTGVVFQDQHFVLHDLSAEDKADAESLIAHGGGTLHAGPPGTAHVLVCPLVCSLPLLVRKRSKAGAYEKATRNDYTKFLLQMFKRTGKRVSSTMIRHSIVSDAYNISHLKQLADEMGHSVGTAMNVYAKEE